MGEQNKRFKTYTVTQLSIIVLLSCLFFDGFLFREENRIPVLGATPSDWNPKSF
jgi:hypothetical protein